MQQIRLLPLGNASGAGNMAADEMMLNTAATRGIASLRLYTWNEPTLSLGYFQPSTDRLTDEKLAALPWVRRATGGAAIVHDPACELTYSLALPSGPGWQPTGDSWVCKFHQVIRKVLAEQKVTAKVVVCGEEQKLGPVLCFSHQTAGDLVVGGSKVAGSAQRKQRGGLLQHGSVLLSSSPLAPQLQGIREVAGVEMTFRKMAGSLATRFVTETKWAFKRGDWTAEETGPLFQESLSKYTSREWNEKR